MTEGGREPNDRRFDELAAALVRLEKRVAAIEHAFGSGGVRLVKVEPEGAREEEAPDRAAAESASGVAYASQLGLLFLVLGGAYLLRAITDSGWIPGGAGTLLGLAYAVFWVFLADRSSGRGRPLAATFRGVAAILVAYPLLWEMTSRHANLGAAVAAGALVAFTLFALFVSIRRGLRFLSHAVVLGAGAATIALLFGTAAFGIFTSLLLLLGGGTVWMAYGLGWRGIQWTPALAANLLVLVLVLVVTTPRGAHPPFDALTPGRAEALAGALLLVYLGSFAVHALVQRKEVGAFEVSQSIAVLLIGFGGAVRIADVTGGRTSLLGVAAVAVGAASYAVGFAFIRRHGRGRNFLLYTSLALSLLVSGTALVFGASPAAVLWGCLSLAAAVLGGRFNRVTLRAHAAVYAALAAVSTGMMRGAVRSFTASADHWPPAPPLAGLAVLALVAGGYASLVMTRKYRECPQLARIPRLVLATVLLFGVAGWAVHLVGGLFAGSGANGVAAVAAVRSTVIALLAIGLAAAKRRGRLPELAFLVYPLLVVGGGKILFEDMHHGVPSCLFVAFAAYGAALIFAPRLLSTRRPREGEPPEGRE